MLWLYILIGIAAVILLLVIIIAMRPADFRYARSTVIAAPASTIFPHVNDFRKMDVWSPWLKYDPNCKVIHEGPPSGTGAIEKWDGDKNVGAGRMTLVESRPNELVRIKLEFFRPFAGTNSGEFTFQPQAGGTTVTWSMTGKHNFMARGMCLFMNMDKMIGGNFEKGLAELKRISEAEAGR